MIVNQWLWIISSQIIRDAILILLHWLKYFFTVTISNMKYLHIIWPRPVNRSVGSKRSHSEYCTFDLDHKSQPAISLCSLMLHNYKCAIGRWWYRVLRVQRWLTVVEVVAKDAANHRTAAPAESADRFQRFPAGPRGPWHRVHQNRLFQWVGAVHQAGPHDIWRCTETLGSHRTQQMGKAGRHEEI